MASSAKAEIRASKLKKWTWLSFVAFVIILPVGAFIGAVGMCAGPSSTPDAFVILAVGVAGIATALYAAFRVIRGIRFGSWPLRIFGMLSLLTSIFVGFVGWIYALEAVDGLKYFLNIGR